MPNTCVNDVASLTEKGTSKTLARVLANNVLPFSLHLDRNSQINVAQLTYQNQLDRCSEF